MVKLGGADAGGVDAGGVLSWTKVCSGFSRLLDGRGIGNRFGSRGSGDLGLGLRGGLGVAGARNRVRRGRWLRHSPTLHSKSSNPRSDGECARLRGGSGNFCGWQGPGYGTEFGTEW